MCCFSNASAEAKPQHICSVFVKKKCKIFKCAGSLNYSNRRCSLHVRGSKKKRRGGGGLSGIPKNKIIPRTPTSTGKSLDPRIQI